MCYSIIPRLYCIYPFQKKFMLAAVTPSESQSRNYFSAPLSHHPPDVQCTLQQHQHQQCSHNSVTYLWTDPNRAPAAHPYCPVDMMVQALWRVSWAHQLVCHCTSDQSVEITTETKKKIFNWSAQQTKPEHFNTAGNQTHLCGGGVPEGCQVWNRGDEVQDTCLAIYGWCDMSSYRPRRLVWWNHLLIRIC